MRYNINWLKEASLDRQVATLFVLRGADAGLRIPLTKDSVTLGRTIEADLVFHDEQISRRHCMIQRVADSDAYVLVDLQSTNGTFLNDRPVTRCELKDGDKIFLGTTVLKFMLEDEVESELVDRLMFQDDLTGLMVKRRFYNELTLKIQAAGAQGAFLSVLMMDMDGLKKVNDTHGHPTGAFVISEAGKIIGEFSNTEGQACRYGGDEFIAYLGASKTEALRVGESIRQAIKDHVFVKENLQLQVTISIGVATFPGDGKLLEALVQSADQALYRAKAKGRNVVSD